MSLKKVFGTDRESVEQGSWIEIVENEDGSVCRIRIKRTNQQNTKFQKAMANHKNAFTGDHYSDKKIQQMTASMIEVIVETILVDWENLEDWTLGPTSEGFPTPEEKYLPFTKENARKVLIEFPDLSELILREADDIANFKSKEADSKN